jgi:hypothetical protein
MVVDAVTAEKGDAFLPQFERTIAVDESPAVIGGIGAEACVVIGLELRIDLHVRCHSWLLVFGLQSY